MISLTANLIFLEHIKTFEDVLQILQQNVVMPFISSQVSHISCINSTQATKIRGFQMLNLKS